MKKGPRNRALNTGERQCVYLDNFSKMRRSLRENDESIINILRIVLFIPASHKQTSYNNYVYGHKPTKCREIYYSQLSVSVRFKHYRLQTGKTVQVLVGDIQQSRGWGNWMENQSDGTSVTIALGLNSGGASPYQFRGQKYSFWLLTSTIM